MLITRIEENDIINVTYNSSNILSSTYDKVTKSLIIIFKNGNRYQYSGVKSVDYLRFETSESQGVTFNTHIKSYPFIKLDSVDTNDTLLIIERELLNIEKDQRSLNITKLKTLISRINPDDSDIADKLLDEMYNVIKLIRKYE